MFTREKMRAFVARLTTKHSPLDVDVDVVVEAVENALGESADASRLPDIVSQVAAALVTRHYDYSLLAGRAIAAKLHQETPDTFSGAMKKLERVLDPEFYARCASGAYDDLIQHENDFQYDVFGISTLHRAYLLKHEGVIVERPQYMLMRVAVFLWGDNMQRVVETYNAMSN